MHWFFWLFSQKGQESAPFELLVAVIVMGFVLLVGFNVISSLQFEECKGKLDNNLEQLKTAIENVAHGEGQRTVSFFLPFCFLQNESRLEIVSRTERQICQEICPGAQVQCTLLAFTSPEHNNWKCLKVSSALDFPGESVCRDFVGDDSFSVERWRVDLIKEGQFILVKKFSEFSSQPAICVYKRVV